MFGNSLRFVLHVMSGVVFFAELAPQGQSVIKYSIVYNASYIIPETIVDILLLQFILKRLKISKQGIL